MKGRNYGRIRSELHRKVRPLGDFVAQAARAKRGETPLSSPPRVQSQGGAGTLSGQSRVPAQSPDASDAGGSRRVRDGSRREAPVLHACLTWLHKRGVFAWRNNTGTAWINGQPVSFGYAGSSDIIGLLPGGKFLAVECKSATGKQSEKQRAFQTKIETSGGVYLLVRSVEELEEQMYGYLGDEKMITPAVG